MIIGRKITIDDDSLGFSGLAEWMELQELGGIRFASMHIIRHNFFLLVYINDFK